MKKNNTQKPDFCPTAGGTPVPQKNSAATLALEESLRSTFAILKYIMLILLIFFCLSGLFFVQEGSVAVHTRFGRILDGPGGAVSGPGGPYFAFPSPIDEVIKIPTTLQEINLLHTFWLHNEGALLTGDKNIVHGKWSATFRIRHDVNGEHNQIDPLLFVKNSGNMDNGRLMVRSVLEQAVVQIIGRSRVENFYQGKIQINAVRRLAQQSLDRLQSGITLTSVALRERTVPAEVSNDFQAVIRAESDKARKIESARQMRTKIMNRVAGSGYRILLHSLETFEKGRQTGGGKAIKDIEIFINDLLLSDEVGGKVASIMQEAAIYRTKTIQSLRGSANRFQEMLALYNENPQFFKHRQTQDVLDRIFQGDIQSYSLPPGDNKSLYLDID